MRALAPILVAALALVGCREARRSFDPGALVPHGPLRVYAPEEFAESRLVKQNSSDILERFTNPEAVREFVASVGRYDWLKE